MKTILQIRQEMIYLQWHKKGDTSPTIQKGHVQLEKPGVTYHTSSKKGVYKEINTNTLG